MVKAEIFNKCLLNKDCDIKAALYKMISSPWNNDEVLDLLQWIQNYNITADKKVTFAGFDMQDYRPAHKRLIHFATATNNKILVKKLKKYTEVQEKAYKESHKESGFNYATPKTAKVMKKQANEIKKAFSNIKDSAWINQYVELLYQYAQMWSSKDYDTINIMRDSFMAQNMIYLHSLYPGKKTVIWAHNGHISNAKEWMGSYLKKEFGNEYLIIGFSSRAGNYSSWKSLCYLTPPDPRCFEYFFPQNNFLLSLKDARSDATGDAKWLNEIKLFRNSTGKSDTQFDPSILVNEFDYIYHIKKTTASKDFID
ncbi:MAG: erythromycin esterase family protein, partial [Bacteroidia bacterium]